MKDIKLGQLGMVIKEKRGGKGLREIAKEIGVSHTTLSRIESGKQPDLDTFSKICTWLDVNPADILNIKNSSSTDGAKILPEFSRTFAVQFRADSNLTPATANKLGEMIIAVQKMINDEQLS